MRKHRNARKDLRSAARSRRSTLAQRRAKLRPLAFGMAMLLATTSPLTAWANGTGTTATTPSTVNSNLYNFNTSSPALDTVGQGGCAQQYTVAIDNLVDQANTDNTNGFYAQDVGLVAQAAGVTAEIVGLSVEEGGEVAQTVSDGAEAATLATEDLVANPSPAAPEAVTR
jgi:hypothetical protein